LNKRRTRSQSHTLIFIGKPQSLTRVEAKHELYLVGGIYSRSLTSNLSYAVAFSGADKRHLFKEIKEFEEKESLKIIKMLNQ
jgi:NAD-dependent DNA ligase